MSASYHAVQWTPYKRRYDLTVIALVLAYVCTFYLGGKLRWRGDHAISDEILLIRAFGTCALLLLHIVLIIGPLCRFSPRFLPLLYNRRHLGVTVFFVGAIHAALDEDAVMECLRRLERPALADVSHHECDCPNNDFQRGEATDRRLRQAPYAWRQTDDNGEKRTRDRRQGGDEEDKIHKGAVRSLISARPGRVAPAR